MTAGTRRTAAALGLAALLAAAAASAEFMARRLPVIIYGGPTETSPKIALVGKDYPFIRIASTADWHKVCLHNGSVGYVRRGDVAPGRRVVIRARTPLLYDPLAEAAKVVDLAAGVLLEVNGQPYGDYLPVRHPAGYEGFVALADAWGHQSAC
ncbi:MAG: hypothetical protein ISN26_05795 [Betaproteobacteria bacterium AqS2]|uniref:SH3 domain-containing protein n=1 Tax=Candidatus Amphirhobacter heronislandensis TaxID=1732024 RepID=A0A930UIK7_9GAMM|nr:hypothetical protein [Betaproteobacteria bacterium AqS2]